MPEKGLQWLPRNEVMSFEEMLRVCSILAKLGIQKVRVTGGEPFIRKDLIYFLDSLVKIKGLSQVTLTTNGVLTKPFIPDLYSMGIRSVNLSLDTLDRQRFFNISRRDELPAVLDTLHLLLKYGIEVKINAVVMEGKNTEDIQTLAALTKELPVSVRFIEEMPFNGDGHDFSGLAWNHVRILNHLREFYPDIQKMTDPPFSTSLNYTIPGHAGSIGIIPAYSRSFCGTCNRIRITPQGFLKTCLYGEGVLNIKDLIRNGSTDSTIERILMETMNQRASDGWEAEKLRSAILHPSMAEIGG
jgi:cyclic pyranopterin phosphate synthase